jgi:hypothetical protein
MNAVATGSTGNRYALRRTQSRRHLRSPDLRDSLLLTPLDSLLAIGPQRKHVLPRQAALFDHLHAVLELSRAFVAAVRSKGEFGACFFSISKYCFMALSSTILYPGPGCSTMPNLTPRDAQPGTLEKHTSIHNHSPDQFLVINSIPLPAPRLREYFISFGLFQCS